MTDQEKKVVENLVFAYQGMQQLITIFNKNMESLNSDQKEYYLKLMREDLKDAIHS